MNRWTAGALAVSAALVLADLALGGAGHVPPGAFAGFAVAGCALLALGAKWLGKHGLQRPAPAETDRADHADE